MLLTGRKGTRRKVQGCGHRARVPCAGLRLSGLRAGTQDARKPLRPRADSTGSRCLNEGPRVTDPRWFRPGLAQDPSPEPSGRQNTSREDRAGLRAGGARPVCHIPGDPRLPAGPVPAPSRGPRTCRLPSAAGFGTEADARLCRCSRGWTGPVTAQIREVKTIILTPGSGGSRSQSFPLALSVTGPRWRVGFSDSRVRLVAGEAVTGANSAHGCPAARHCPNCHINLSPF